MRAALVAAWLIGAGSASAGDLPRAASTTLCGDQYLLALAAPTQIASLSWQATGALSHYADRAADVPRNRGSVEELIAAGADLVVLSDGVAPQTQRALDAFGIAYVQVQTGADIDDVASNVRLVSVALGRGASGEATIEIMNKRLAKLELAAGRQRPLVAYYRPGGGGAGDGTFVDGTLRAAGYRNLQSELGMRGWSGLPVEMLVRHPPDGFVVSFFDTTPHSVRSRLGQNPILATAMGDGPVISVPGRYWLCAHPLLVDAAETLAIERTRLLETLP